jgi:hypothetical protein
MYNTVLLCVRWMFFRHFDFYQILAWSLSTRLVLLRKTIYLSLWLPFPDDQLVVVLPGITPAILRARKAVR